mmetsp:Transcript_16548/g.38200  ORF Transcript_16548/g.38200 Transcript_16548/m.38200 type:complete len:244 (-) Transcript_16548:1503-2234(-)
MSKKNKESTYGVPSGPTRHARRSSMRSGYTCTQIPWGKPPLKISHSRCTRLVNCRTVGPAPGVFWTKWWSLGTFSHTMSSNVISTGSASSSSTSMAVTPCCELLSVVKNGPADVSMAVSSSPLVPAPLALLCGTSLMLLPPVLLPSSSSSSSGLPGTFPSSVDPSSASGATSPRSSFMSAAAVSARAGSMATSPVVVSACESTTLASSSSPSLKSSLGLCSVTVPSSHRTRTLPDSRATTCPT